MAKVYGEVDSLESLISIFNENDIDHLSTLEDIKLFEIQFDKKIKEIERNVKEKLDIEIENLKINIPKLKSDLKGKIEEEEKKLLKKKDKLLKEIQELSKKPKKFYLIPINLIKKIITQKIKESLIKNFKSLIKKPFLEIEKRIKNDEKSLKYLEDNLDKEIQKRTKQEADLILKTKNILEENKQLYIGAIGEQKAAEELNKLPNEYTLINNFKIELTTPIYNKSTNQRIYSIQADHIVVGPTGIFLIETKNWSQSSINNLDLYSPVEQIKRSSFGLFCILNNAVKTGELPLFNDNWGDKKISVRNILLMVSAMPKKEFQFVKILDLPGVIRYIKYFDRIYSDKEVEELVEFLV